MQPRTFFMQAAARGLHVARRESRRFSERLRRMQGRDLAIGFGGLLAGVALAGLAIQTPKQKSAVPLASATPAESSQTPVTTAQEASSIKIIGASTGAAPCTEQTWPYIERRCLTDAPPRQTEPVAQAAVAAVPAPTPTASANDRAAAAPTSTLSDVSPKPVQAATVTAAPETTGVAAKSEAEIPAVAKPAAERKTAARRKDERRRVERQDASFEDDQPEGTGDARNHHGNKGKVVKRWRELVYDYPDGSRKRVMMNGSRASGRPVDDDD